MKNYKFLLPSFLSVLLLFWASFGFADSTENKVTQIRSNSLKEHLQIVLDLEKAPNFNAFSLSSPMRLVVDVKAKPSKFYKNNLDFKHRGVTLVRTGMRSDNEIRVVLDLVKDFHWEVYALPPSDRHSYRIVIDVYDRAKKPPKQATYVAKEALPTPKIELASVPATESVATPATTIVLESGKNLNTQAALTGKANKTNKSVAVNKQSKKIVANNTKTNIRDANKSKAAKKTLVKPVVASQKVIRRTFSNTTQRPPKQNKIVVVIDAGHGGKDSGARGSGNTFEKHVVLQIAKRLARKINAIKGMKAVLTRKHDNYISLRGRLRLARKYKADLFVSIHADAARNHDAQGASIYILSKRGASSESARWLAKRENAVDLKYGVDIGDYDKDVGDVLMQIQQDATIEASQILAKRTLSKLKGIGPVHKHSVERAGFAVLKSPDIPSMLVETAFISNAAEERKLRSSRYQDKLATAISQGIQQYFKEHIPHHLMLIDAPK